MTDDTRIRPVPYFLVPFTLFTRLRTLRLDEINKLVATCQQVGKIDNLQHVCGVSGCDSKDMENILLCVFRYLTAYYRVYQKKVYSSKISAILDRSQNL